MYGLSPGTRIGPYVLETALGAGGQGSVWRAHHEATPTEAVALKIIPVRGAPLTMVERVRREAEALVRLSSGHPSVVSCRGLVEDDAQGVLAVAMELVSGVELSAALADRRCDMAAREAILGHVAAALAHLHAAGFVHRDIKPANVLVTHGFYASPHDPATVKLVDFGIATPTGNPKPLTEVGTVIGTPAYMPPERMDPLFWSPAPSAPTEDVFAFGVLAYESLFGKHPAGVTDDGTLSTYAEKYRAVSRSGVPWPELPPAHKWSYALRGSLALKRTDRLPDGAAVVAAISGAAPAATADVPVSGGQKTEVAPQLGADAFTPAPALGAWTPPPALGAWTPPPAANAYPPPAHHAPIAPVGASFPAIAAPPPMHHAPARSGSSMFLIIGIVAALGVVTVGGLLIAQRSSSDDLPPPVALPAGSGDAPPATVTTTPDAPPDTAATTPIVVPPPPPVHPPVGTVTHHPPNPSGTVVVGPPGHTAPPTATAPPTIGGPPHIGPRPPPVGAPPTTTVAPPATTPPATPPTTTRPHIHVGH